MKNILIGLGVGLLIFVGYWFFVLRDGSPNIVENVDLVESYDNMAVGEDGINGYMLQLNIFGLIDGERVRESVRIRNYMDEQFEISIMHDSEPEYEEREENENEEEFDENDYYRYETDEEVYFIIDGKTYVRNDDRNYVETDKTVKYNNPSLFLEGVRNVTKDGERVEEKHGMHTYYSYEIMVDRKIVQEMLDTTNIEYTIENDVEATVLLDENDYVYRIVYKFDRLTIQASFFLVDNMFEMHVPLDDYYDDEF